MVFLPATEEERSTAPAPPPPAPSSPGTMADSANAPTDVPALQALPDPPLEKDESLSPLPSVEEGDRTDAGNSPPPCFWTWRLLSSQFSIGECCLIRRLSREEVLAHVVEAVEVGLPLTLDAVLSDEAAALLRQVDHDRHPDCIDDLFSNLPETISRREAELYWLLRS